LFSYDFQGARWSLEIPAKSAAEAQFRLNRMAAATYDGEVHLSVRIPTGPIGRILARLGLWRSSSPIGG
jgi:hypothetical protein